MRSEYQALKQGMELKQEAWQEKERAWKCKVSLEKERGLFEVRFKLID